MKKSLGIFCPKNYLYLNEIKSIKYNEVNLKTNNLLYIIHEILLKFQLDDDDVELEEFTFNLYSKILRDKYGSHYKYYIDYLISINFISLKSNYFVGKKSKTYVLNWFNLDDIKRIHIYDNILLKNSYKEYHRKLNAKSPIPLYIRKKLVSDMDSVKINYCESEHYINNLKEIGSITSSKYFKNYQSIINIKEKNIYFIFDDWGRLHTNFTVLKKEIRKRFVTIDDSEIYELDINNSQPFFLSKIIKKQMNNNDPEVKLFVDLVNKGLFYDYFIDKFPKYFIYEEKENKIYSKKLVYKVLFGYNGIKSEQSKIFKKLFPNIFEYIITVKKSNSDYKCWSYKLMRMESDFIFKVVDEIYRQIKNIKLFTVHDSISFPIKYKDKVETIFYSYLKNYDNLFDFN